MNSRRDDGGTGRAAALVAEAGIRLTGDQKRLCRIISDGPVGVVGDSVRAANGEGWARAIIDNLVKYRILELIDVEACPTSGGAGGVPERDAVTVTVAVLRGDPPPAPATVRRFVRPDQMPPAQGGGTPDKDVTAHSGPPDGGSAEIRAAIASAPVVASPDDPSVSSPSGPPDGSPVGPPGPPDGGGPEGPRDGGIPGDDPGAVDWDLVKRCAAEPATDIGNGRRFRHRHAADAIYVHRIGWSAYDGRRWAEDIDDARVRRFAHLTAELIALEATFVEPTDTEAAAIKAAEDRMDRYDALVAKGAERLPAETSELTDLRKIVATAEAAQKAVGDRRRARRRFATSSGNKGKLDGMLNEAKPYRGVDLGDLDADPLAFNVRNGTLRFVHEPDPECPDPDTERLRWTVRLDPHARDDMITKLAPVDYDPDALAAPAFAAFIRRVMPDADTRHFVQRFLGYAMTALTREQVFVFFWGQGRNGKSTLVDLICRIVGDYSTSVPFETLAGDDRRRGSEATPDLARLPGARLVRAAEPEQRMRFRESMVKSLTSGEPIPVRRLHADFVDVYPTFKLVVSGNHKPTIEGTDEGIWRRVLLVPWEVQIPKDEIDANLPEKLWAERRGVLNWLVRGALDYLETGLEPPPAVRAATEEYREESDPIGAFLKTACEITRDPTDIEPPGEIYEAYVRFSKKAGFTPWKDTTFTRRLPDKAAAMGFTKAKTGGMTVYRGLRIRPEFRVGDAFDAPSHSQERF